MPTNLNPKEVLNDYIFSTLLPVITHQDCPKTLNLLTSLKLFLGKKINNEIQKEELAIKWMPDLIRRLTVRLEDWNSLGIPYPCCISEENDKSIITWKHPRYEEFTGFPSISENFIGIMQWVDTLNSREFLIVCAVLLKTLGATKIFITDGPNDGGLDLIARIERSPFNSIVFFVQSKTVQNKASLITRDTVLMEYGKYLSLPHEDIYQRYRRALDLDRSADGVSYCYSIMANSEFHNSAKEISCKIGVLLRSKIQISYFLSHIVDTAILEAVKTDLKDFLKADTTINIADKINI